MILAFEIAISLRLQIYDNEIRNDNFAALGKMLGGGDSSGDSFQSAGTIYPKPHKPETIEYGSDGKITERQKQKWKAEGCDVW